MFCICTLSSDTAANATAPCLPSPWSKKHKIRIQQQQAPSSVNHKGNNSQRGCWEHGEGVRGGCPRAAGHQQQQALLSSRFLSRRGMSGFTASFMPSPFFFFFFVLHILYQTGVLGKFSNHRVLQCGKLQILRSIRSISAIVFPVSRVTVVCPRRGPPWKSSREDCALTHTQTHTSKV